MMKNDIYNCRCTAVEVARNKELNPGAWYLYLFVLVVKTNLYLEREKKKLI